MVKPVIMTNTPVKIRIDGIRFSPWNHRPGDSLRKHADGMMKIRGVALRTPWVIEERRITGNRPIKRLLNTTLPWRQRLTFSSKTTPRQSKAKDMDVQAVTMSTVRPACSALVSSLQQSTLDTTCGDKEERTNGPILLWVVPLFRSSTSRVTKHSRGNVVTMLRPKQKRPNVARLSSLQ